MSLRFINLVLRNNASEKSWRGENTLCKYLLQTLRIYSIKMYSNWTRPKKLNRPSKLLEVLNNQVRLYVNTRFSSFALEGLDVINFVIDFKVTSL